MGRYGTAWRGTASSVGAPGDRARLQSPAMATPRDQNAIVIDPAGLAAEGGLGPLGVSPHGPYAAALLPRFQRTYADIDFAGYRRQAKGLATLLAGLGYVDGREGFITSEGRRSIFDAPPCGPPPTRWPMATWTASTSAAPRACARRSGACGGRSR